MFHTCILAGHLGRDPEMRYLPDGTAVTNFSIAVNDGWGDNKKTIWFRVSAWRKQAETVNAYLSKGSKVLVEGRLQADENGNPRLWNRQDGSVSSSFELTATNVTFLSSKAENDALSNSENGAYPTGGGEMTVNVHDIPFAQPLVTTLDCNPIGLSPQDPFLAAEFPIH